MSNRTTRLAIVIAAVVVAAFVAAVAIRAFSGGPGTATKPEYQATVVDVRNRVDYAYAQVGKATSIKQLADALDQASAVVAQGAKDLDHAGVAPGFGDLNGQLSDKLRQFSGSMADTAAQIRDPSFQPSLGGLNSIGFTEWDDVNAILTKMKAEGLRVELLQRH